MPSAISIRILRFGGHSHIPWMLPHALGSLNLHSPPLAHSLNAASCPRQSQFTFPAPASRPQLPNKYYIFHLHFLRASLVQQSTPAVHSTRSSRHSQFTTHSSCNLILPLAHRDWQRSRRSGAVAAAFTKLKIQWMYIIKTRSLTVSYNLTTDIG
jgi:hypothetical protein